MRSKRSFFHPHHPRKRGSLPLKGEACAWSPPFGGDHAGALSLDTDKSQFKAPPNIQTSSRPKINGPRKERPREERSLPSANTGRAPPAWADYVRTPSIGRQKTFSQKGFCGAFSLKKRPSAPAGAPAPQRPYISKFSANFAFCSMKSLRGSTLSPMRREKVASHIMASSMVTRRMVRFSGSIVVSQS